MAGTGFLCSLSPFLKRDKEQNKAPPLLKYIFSSKFPRHFTIFLAFFSAEKKSSMNRIEPSSNPLLYFSLDHISRYVTGRLDEMMK